MKRKVFLRQYLDIINWITKMFLQHNKAAFISPKASLSKHLLDLSQVSLKNYFHTDHKKV